ncbi:MAG: helix-turn-helix domain-containing protein [Salibacteraceae bacterium]
MVEKVGRKIRQHRELRRFTQEFMASQLDIALKTYSRYELEEGNITIERLNQICKILEIDALQLLGSDLSNIFNNNNYHSEGDFVAYNATSIKEVKELYEKLLLEKEKRIEEKDALIRVLKKA